MVFNRITVKLCWRSAGKYCWDRDYKAIISPIKDRYGWMFVLVVVGMSLSGNYGKRLAGERHTVRIKR